MSPSKNSKKTDSQDAMEQSDGGVPKFRDFKRKCRRFYAIGDIHGCSGELKVMLEYLRDTASLSEDDQVLFIGDYIDRGPDSRGVIELLLEFQNQFPETIFLRGNHEDMLLGYLNLGGSAGEVYLQNGGNTFFESYGIPAASSIADVLKGIPADHITFLSGLDRYVIGEKYVFAHAGLNPLRDLRFQHDEDLFWIREAFILNMHYFKKTIVFGHTPYEDVLIDLPYKIGIDTGLVYGNKLSCLELQNGHIFQVAHGGSKVELSTLKEHQRRQESDELIQS